MLLGTGKKTLTSSSVSRSFSVTFGCSAVHKMHSLVVPGRKQSKKKNERVHTQQQQRAAIVWQWQLIPWKKNRRPKTKKKNESERLGECWAQSTLRHTCRDKKKSIASNAPNTQKSKSFKQWARAISSTQLHGMARHGTARHGTKRHGMAWHSTHKSPFLLLFVYFEKKKTFCCCLHSVRFFSVVVVAFVFFLLLFHFILYI